MQPLLSVGLLLWAYNIYSHRGRLMGKPRGAPRPSSCQEELLRFLEHLSSNFDIKVSWSQGTLACLTLHVVIFYQDYPPSRRRFFRTSLEKAIDKNRLVVNKEKLEILRLTSPPLPNNCSLLRQRQN